jgi:hypothetical protein
MPVTFTREEAHRSREAARARHRDAESHTDSWARTIAMSAVRDCVADPPLLSSAKVSGDDLIVARAAEHEAYADWQDARVRCGFEAL